MATLHELRSSDRVCTCVQGGGRGYFGPLSGTGSAKGGGRGRTRGTVREVVRVSELEKPQYGEEIQPDKDYGDGKKVVMELVRITDT